jgi:hypothetical protein
MRRPDHRCRRPGETKDAFCGRRKTNIDLEAIGTREDKKETAHPTRGLSSRVQLP